MKQDDSLPPVPDPAEVPTLPLTLGGRYFDMSRNTAYAAAARGDFPADVIKVGGRWRVVTASLRRVLQLDEAG